MMIQRLLERRIAPTAIALKKACLQCVEDLDGNHTDEFAASMHNFMSHDGR